MSKKSSARTGSEGDADSLIGEVFPNARSRSSSHKSKQGGLEAGPYGDSPSDQQTYKDCFFYMLQDNDFSDSSGDEASSELYSLRTDYLEKLNDLRKKLDLIELNDERGGCTITEIIEEEPEPPGEGSQKQSTSTSEPESVEIKTLHPFSVCYNLEAQSITNVLELEYNPPKKKSCFRLRTPKLPSASESNLPYHTKVSLREDLFQKPSEASAITKECYDKFTRTQETQVEAHDVGENVNLFPTVIVEEKPVEYPLNYVGDASSSSYNSRSTSTTTVVDAPEPRRMRKPLQPLKEVVVGQQQYLTYRKERLRAKSSPIKRRKCVVPFGPVLLNDADKDQNLDSRYYLFNSSSASEVEAKYLDEISRRFGSGGLERKEEEEEEVGLWARLFGCFRPVFSFIARR